MKENTISLNRKEIIYLDILKIFACIMVIINHTNNIILENDSLFNIIFYCITYSLCKTGVPIFLMVTGTLILDKDYNYKKILKCISRIIIPTFVLSLLFYISDVGIFNINIIKFLKSILSEPYIFPYWYIYSLIGIYLALPFIQKMIKNFTNKDYINFICIFLLIPLFIGLLEKYLKLNISKNFFTAFFPLIISVVICGNYISKIKLSKKMLHVSIITFILSHIIMFLSLYLPYIYQFGISYTLDYWDTLPAVLMSISLFYIIRYYYEDKVFLKKTTDIITTITSTTFGIYLIHTFIYTKINSLSIIHDMICYNAVITIILIDAFLFFACMIIVYLLKQIIKKIYIKR